MSIFTGLLIEIWMGSGGRDNLFSNLNRWAIRQNENFTTESLVLILKRLLSDKPDVACRLLKNFTDGFLDLSNEQATRTSIQTQTTIDEGKPDIEITVDDYLVYIEVKIDSELGVDQLTRYRHALESADKKRTLLVFLSRYPLTSTNNGTPDVAVRWYQIADWIEGALLKNQIDDVNKFLLNQFLDYLKKQHLTLSKVKSPISIGLNSYRERVGDPATKLGRMRSFDRLNKEPELKPLRNLLKIMKEAFETIKVMPRLESGKTQGGWAGFVFNRIEGAFCIYYYSPETVVYETYNLKIDLDKFDGKIGKIWMEGRRMRWKNELDLKDVGFFQNEKKGQLEVIQSFLKESYAYSRSIGVR